MSLVYPHSANCRAVKTTAPFHRSDQLRYCFSVQVGTKENVGYFASWGDWNPSQGALSGIPTYVTTGEQNFFTSLQQSLPFHMFTSP